jgi:hypothetical protein
LRNHKAAIQGDGYWYAFFYDGILWTCIDACYGFL